MLEIRLYRAWERQGIATWLMEHKLGAVRPGNPGHPKWAILVKSDIREMKGMGTTVSLNKYVDLRAPVEENILLEQTVIGCLW